MGSPKNGTECYSFKQGMPKSLYSVKRIVRGMTITPKRGGVNMKKTFYNFMGWLSLVVGAVLFIIPGLPGAPILLLSKYFFSI